MIKKILIALSIISIPFFSFSSEPSFANFHSYFPLTFLFLIVLLLFGKIGSLATRFKQPAVLGELIMGIILSALAFIPGLNIISILAQSHLVKAIAEIGVILLLFRAGLESNIHEMKAVGIKSLIVAIVGVILPFIGGFLASKALLPSIGNNGALFLGATLTATSVGITTRVFKDLNILKSLEAKIVLGAAVIDDILGLLILAVVGAIVSTGHITVSSIGIITIKAFIFLIGSIVIGRITAPFIGSMVAKIHPGVGMKMALALFFCAIFSYGAFAIAGLSPIIGAFASGLILDPVHFKDFLPPSSSSKINGWISQINSLSTPETNLINEMRDEVKDSEKMHVENLIDGVSSFFVPIFFVYTGLQTNLLAFSNIKTVTIALIITAIAFLGKILCGYFAGKKVNPKIIGFGMVPRGEVGLIFLSVGQGLGVVNSQIFAIGIIMIILSTILTPPILNRLISKEYKATVY